MASAQKTIRDPADTPALGQVLEFMRVIWAFDHALNRASKRMEATLGITAPQRLVIRILGRFPGMRAGQLARLLHLHPSTLTGILQRLQRRGLITRRVDPSDRRRVILGLTAKGRALDVERTGTVETAVKSAFTILGPGRLDDTAEILGKLIDLIDDRIS
jgi:MarR family transcriptional regulator, organic hydroperoxide resistance regulator